MTLGKRCLDGLSSSHVHSYVRLIFVPRDTNRSSCGRRSECALAGIISERDLRGTGYFSEGAKWDRATVLRLRRVWRDFGRRFPTEGGRLSALFRGSNNRRTPTPGGCDTAR